MEAWEILLEQLTREMDSEPDLARRVALYQERETLLRTWLPLTPLIAPRVYWDVDGTNILPERYLDTIFLELAGPGNWRDLIGASE